MKQISSYFDQKFSNLDQNLSNLENKIDSYDNQFDLRMKIMERYISQVSSDISMMNTRLSDLKKL